MRRVILFILFLALITGCANEDFKRTPQSDLLRRRDFTKVILEVVYFDKLSPPPTYADLDYLKSKILCYCHKDAVIIVVEPPKSAMVVGTLLWDTSVLVGAEKRFFDLNSAGDTVVVHIFYVPGYYLPSVTTLGLAYGDHAFALFRNSFGQSQERGVLLHEFGHLVGLVNTGTPCQSVHEETDPLHKLHCKNDCVMHWCSPDSQTPDFDEACKEDLRANGGR